MKNEAYEKIEQLKKIKFGVEVEMYDITRRDAAYALGDLWGTTDTINRGDQTYHRYVVNDQQGRKWQFLSDSSIRDYNDGCELVTPLLTYEDMEQLQVAIRKLRKSGGKSDPDHNCGIHVHVDIGDMTAKQLINLVNMTASHEELIKMAISIDSSRANEWSQPVNPNFLRQLFEQKPDTLDKVMEIWYKSMGYDVDDRFEHYNRSRYHLLNLHSLWQNKGVEFRCFQFANPTGERRGGLHAGELKAYIQLCLGMVATSKEVASVKSKPSKLQKDNPQYAMMRFLRKLGLKGGEFKTLRDVMFRHLEGDARCRHYEEVA